MSTNREPQSTTLVLAQKLERLRQQTQDWHERFPTQIESLSELCDTFNTQLKRLEQDGLKLNIAIMGQVKAGKSSFLNALLFGGKPVLPEAATPKTANLTRISYGKKPSLTVSYYNREEWDDITDQAHSTSTSQQAKVGRDLQEMVQKNGIVVDDVLAQDSTVLEADSIDGLMHLLNDYVGENGRYTALVKATDITLPLDELKGFDVVDTPGMNDPVSSRSIKAREYMAQCDVVFFLSRSSQFLDQSDIDLLAHQLPTKGVKRMVLVAVQVDAAISDDGFNRKSLSETEANLAKRLSLRAENEMEKLAAARESTNEQTPSSIPAMLRTLKKPIIASTFAYGFAEWPTECWGNSMQHVYTELQEMARDCWKGYTILLEDWQRIGNFGALQAAYRVAREDKQAVLQEQREQLTPETESELQRCLRALTQAVQIRQHQLSHSDLRDLEQRMNACQASIGSISKNLSRVVDEVKANCTTAQTAARKALSDNSQRSAKLDTRQGTDSKKVAKQEAYEVEERFSREVSDSSWYNPFSWGSTRTKYWSEYRTEYRTVYKTVTSNYEYIETADAIEKLVSFGRNSAAEMERHFNDIVHLSSLRAKLKTALVEALDTSADDFDPNEFRSVFDNCLDKLSFPLLKIELGNIESNISSRFSGNVRGSEIKSLQKAQQEAVQSLQENLRRCFDEGVQQLQDALQATSLSLVAKLSQALQAEREQLQRAFADKENELALCAKLLTVCEPYQAIQNTQSVKTSAPQLI